MKMSDLKTRAWQSKGSARKYHRATASSSDLSYMLVELYLQTLADFAPPGSKVLDMGCGTGVISMALADRGYSVTAVDVSNEMLDQLRENIGARSIELSRGNIFSLPVPDNSFDAIISRWVLPHFPQWPLAVIEAARKLKPGGMLLFDMCNSENVDLARSMDEIPASLGYVFGPTENSRFYADASPDQLDLIAQSAGLELALVRPLGFFRANAVIASALGDRNYSEYKLELEQRFANEQVNEFVRWFEATVTPRLPLAMATEAIVAMRKPGSSGRGPSIADGLKAWVKRWV